MKIYLLVFFIFLVSCAKQDVNKNKVVAVGIDDEVYEIDRAASVALTNKDEGSKIVCEKTQKTGSRISSRTCTTKAQKDAARALHQEKLRDEQSRQRRVLNRMRSPTDGG